jgi:ribonucleoside-diphosphate reductase alpha chain
VRLTAIEPHPRLALLANNVSDALDPLSAPDARCRVDAPDGARTLASAGFARSLRRQLGLADDESFATPVQAQLAAQTEMRAALQPWVDRPIEYALRVGTPPAAPLAAW